MLCLMEKNMHLSDREDIISAHQQKILNEKVQSDFIEQFGSFILARKCRKAIAFTIKMVTLLITTLTTWSVYQLANTLRNTTKKGLRMLNVLKNNLSCLTKSDRKPLRGTPRRKGKSGTLNIQKKWASGFAHIKTIFVKIVEKNLHQETIAPYTVARNVDNNIRQKRTKELNLKTYASCVVNHSHIQSRFMGEIQDHDKRVQNYVKTGSITETEKRENVYNLTIDEIGVFYANGILVSNCDTAALAAEKLKVYQKRARIIITGKI